jgi:predicted DNA-binding protein (UPF0251 family)
MWLRSFVRDVLAKVGARKSIPAGRNSKQGVGILINPDEERSLRLHIDAQELSQAER